MDDLGSFVDLEECQVGSAGDREEHAAGAVDGLLEKRRHDGLTCGLGRARLALAVTNAH